MAIFEPTGGVGTGDGTGAVGRPAVPQSFAGSFGNNNGIGAGTSRSINVSGVSEGDWLADPVNNQLAFKVKGTFLISVTLTFAAQANETYEPSLGINGTTGKFERLWASRKLVEQSATGNIAVDLAAIVYVDKADDDASEEIGVSILNDSLAGHSIINFDVSDMDVVSLGSAGPPGRNAPVLSDAEIGDKAFSNPPGDLSNTEKAAARTAIGAGTGDGDGDGTPPTWDEVSGKPNFARVATSGAYGDLSGRPAAYVLPAATESTLGGVRNVSVDQAADTAGTTFLAWSSAMVTKLIAVWRTPMPQDEAEAGSSGVARFISADVLRAAINAVVPAVFRTGNTARIDPAKLGTGVRDEDRVLHGDGAWRLQAGGLMRELFNGLTGATVAEERVGDFEVPNDNNVVLLIEVGNAREFHSADDFVALRESDGETVGTATVYSNADRHFLLKLSSPTQTSVRVWAVEDVEAFAEIAERFLPTVTQIDAEAGASEQRRIWNALRVWQAARAATADSITGLSRNGQVLTGTRRGGTNPEEVTLPTAGGGGVALEQVGARFTQSGAGVEDVWHATGITVESLGSDDIAYIRTSNPGDSDPPQYNIIRGETFDALTVKADGDAVASGDVRWQRHWAGSAAGLAIVRTAAGEILAAGAGGASAGWWIEVYRPSGAADNTRSGLVDVGRFTPAADVGANPLLWQATGIILPDNPPDVALFEWFAYVGNNSINGALRGIEIKALPIRVAGASAAGAQAGTSLRVLSGLSAAKTSANELLIAVTAGLTAATDYFYLFRIQTDAVYDQPSGYLFYARPTLTIPADITADTSISAAGHEVTLLNAQSVTGRIYSEVDFTTEWFGGFDIQGTWPGGGSQIRTLVVDIETTHTFNGKTFRLSRQATRPWRNQTQTHFSLTDFESFSSVPVGTYRPRGGNPDGSDDITISEADLLGPVEISYKIIIRGRDQGGNYDPFTLNSLHFENVQTRSYQIAHGEGAPEPVPSPSITEFSLTGDLAPAAGDIGGTSYDFATAIAHSSRVTAARLVGFAGTSPAGAVTVLRTLTEAEFHAATGRITLPSGPINLAADESYTIRLEVYGTGQTVGTDEAATHQDRRITAHAAAAASYHWGRVQLGADGETAAQTAGRIVFATDDTTTGNSLLSQYTAEIPDDGNSYQNYLAVQDGQPEPAGFTQAGLDASGSWNAAVDHTYGGTDFSVFVLKSLFAATHDEDDGRVWGIRR